jgi:hypothetical protein
MVDRYTKSVLTVIAIALSVIAVRGVLPVAHAQDGEPIHVILDQVGNNQPMGYGELTVKVDSSDSN